MDARRRSLAVPLVSLLLASGWPLSAQDPPQAGTLTITTSSAEARSAFWSGLEDIDHIFPVRGGQHFQRALGLDPTLGIARVAYGLFTPGLSEEQRDQEINRGVADAAKASTGELLLALAWRARTSARAEERRLLIKAAAELLPGDSRLAYLAAVQEPNVRTRVTKLEDVTRRFPDYAPTYNALAYGRATLGELDAAVTIAEQQMKLAPNHPNPHDSYAEMMQWSGKLDQAAQHYQAAMRLHADYVAAHTGLAEVAILKGDGATARTHYGHAIQKDPSAAARLGYRSAIAVSYVNEGNVKAAVDELTAVAQEAERDKLTAVAAGAHRNLAVIEAALGDKSTPHGHLAKALELGGDNAAQQAFAAVTHALLGHLNPARGAAAKYAEGASAPNATPALVRNVHSVNGILAAAEDNATKAVEESRMAAQAGALAKLLAAETLKKGGKTAEAQALGKEVMDYYQVDLFTVIAKQRAKKL